jgi:hypothetical protein
VSFTGGFYRWVEEEAQKGHTVQLAFGRLSAIWDLCGPLEFLESSVQYEKEGYCLRLYAKGKRGEDIFLEERRTVGGARGTVWEISSNQGAVFTAPPRKREDLFAMDLRRMYERIPCDVEIDAICGFIDTAHHSMVEVI